MRKRAGRLTDTHTDWDGTLEDLQANIRPFTDRFEVDAAINQGLREVAPTCTKSVRADGDRTGHFIRLEELDSLGDREQLEKLRREELVVAVVACNVGDQLLRVLYP